MKPPARSRRGGWGLRALEGVSGREGSGPGEAWTELAVTYLSSGGADICTPARGKDGTREAICLRTGFPESRLGPAVVFPYFLTGPWFPDR